MLQTRRHPLVRMARLRARDLEHRAIQRLGFGLLAPLALNDCQLIAAGFGQLVRFADGLQQARERLFVQLDGFVQPTLFAEESGQVGTELQYVAVIVAQRRLNSSSDWR